MTAGPPPRLLGPLGGEGSSTEAETAAACRSLAAKVWAEDPVGTFTSALPFAAALEPPEEKGELTSGWVTGGADWVPPEFAAARWASGEGREPAPDWPDAGLERVSATTLDCPAM
jgi:hypothetical protein